ncbi:MAG: alpha/beta fold hydrolase [Caulobacterales bacterium]|jgi:pimeloyl-ACP methyl ester carboxylesterase
MTATTRRALILAAAAAACNPPKPPTAPTRFRVATSGAGPDVILVHGLASSPAVWAQTVEAFSSQCRLHVLHIAGFDAVPAGPNAAGLILPAIADDIARYIESAKLEKPILIGHSMGGVIGMLTAIRHRSVLGRLMVIDALPWFSVLLNPAITRIEALMQADAARDALLRQSAAEFEAGQRAAIARLVTSADDQARALAWALRADRMVMARAMHEVMTTDLRLEVAKITTPTSVLCAHDASMRFPPAAVEAAYRINYAALRGVDILVIDAARHYLMLDQPERFAGELRVFLRA